MGKWLKIKYNRNFTSLYILKVDKVNEWIFKKKPI